MVSPAKTESPTSPELRSEPRHNEYKPKSLDLIGSHRSVRKIAVRTGLTLVIVLAALYFVPWQQTVSGSGEVSVYDAMSRPQTVQAQIPARLVEWRVQEGQTVQKGQVIAVLEDIDSKFLDPTQLRRIREQRTLAEQTRLETERRVNELLSQRSELGEARQNAIAVARQGITQAQKRADSLEQVVRQARQQLEIRRDVAVKSAKERKDMASDRVVQAEQSLLAARQQETTMRQRRDRISYLKQEGLRSGQELEFAENDLVKAQTEVQRALKALDIAKRDLRVGNLAQDQADVEVRMAEAAVEKAVADADVAQREVLNAQLNLNRIISDTQAQLSRVGADVQSARESLAKSSSEIQKIDIDVSNTSVRIGQRTLLAPTDGRIARLLKVGAGATVKPGDELAVVVPKTADQVVELYVTDNDVALLDVGRPVRVQFAGWPALQFSGFPSVAVGTFGGRIKVIDPVDDGTARYRVLVEPDRQRLVGGRLDEPWPTSDRLRPGAEAAGWILLDTVPLGFELWRQYNGFPPRIRQQRPLTNKKGDKGDSEKSEKTKDPYLGPIKLKSK